MRLIVPSDQTSVPTSLVQRAKDLLLEILLNLDRYSVSTDLADFLFSVDEDVLLDIAVTTAQTNWDEHAPIRSLLTTAQKFFINWQADS